MQDLEFSFHPSQRELFRSGKLISEWAKKYPQLFDEHDVRITHNQPHYHFFEWLGAILLYESLGYLSLIEKYETPKHTKKIETIKSTIPQKVINYIFENRAGLPDLFVYSPDKQDWFFCEVKGLGDRLQRNQIRVIGKLEEVTGKAVKILKFREFKT